jgi:hypothetical protein
MKAQATTLYPSVPSGRDDLPVELFQPHAVKLSDRCIGGGIYTVAPNRAPSNTEGG